MHNAYMLATFVFWLVASSYQVSYTHLSWLGSSHMRQVDRWTISRTGCACPYNSEDKSCPCCGQGGCSCGQGGRCVQCGLEQGCEQSERHID